MGIFDKVKKTVEQIQGVQNTASGEVRKVLPSIQKPVKPAIVRNSPNSFADSSSIPLDERPFYQPDSYYTFYSHPGTEFAEKVITFEERKRKSYPSVTGLYVAEILLLEYVSYGKYPKPKSGYPGFWWFQYGIRDVGLYLASLEQRGYIRKMSKLSSLSNLKVDELKAILEGANLPTNGKKAELIERIAGSIPEQYLQIPNFAPKYELTDLGKNELLHNGYVPYMHKHSHATTEDTRFGEEFNVWSINRLFRGGDAMNWRQVVGAIEKKRFGVDMANAAQSEPKRGKPTTDELYAKRDEMRNYLAAQGAAIRRGIKSKGDGLEEEMRGIDLKKIGRDKEALVQFYIAIGKEFDAPALYKEAAILLRKYGMLDEELAVVDAGVRNVPRNNSHRNELIERRKKILELKQKEST